MSLSSFKDPKNKFNIKPIDEKLNSNEIIGTRKLSKADEKSLSIGKNNQSPILPVQMPNTMKRFSNIYIPNEHKYSMNSVKNRPYLFENKLDKANKDDIKYAYNSHELTSVFVHLLYLKKFTIPEEFKEEKSKEFWSEISHPIPKTLEHFRKNRKSTDLSDSLPKKDSDSSYKNTTSNRNSIKYNASQSFNSNFGKNNQRISRHSFGKAFKRFSNYY